MPSWRQSTSASSSTGVTGMFLVRPLMCYGGYGGWEWGMRGHRRGRRQQSFNLYYGNSPRNISQVELLWHIYSQSKATLQGMREWEVKAMKVLGKWGSGEVRYEEVRGWDSAIRRQELRWQSDEEVKLTSKHFSFPPFCELVLLLLGEALPLLLHGPVFFLFVPSCLYVLNFRQVEGIVVQEIVPYLPSTLLLTRPCEEVRGWGSDRGCKNVTVKWHGTQWWKSQAAKTPNSSLAWNLFSFGYPSISTLEWLQLLHNYCCLPGEGGVTRGEACHRREKGRKEEWV